MGWRLPFVSKPVLCCFLAVTQLWQQHGLRSSTDTDVILTVTNQSALKKHRAASKVEVHSFLQATVHWKQSSNANSRSIVSQVLCLDSSRDQTLVFYKWKSPEVREVSVFRLSLILVASLGNITVWFWLLLEDVVKTRFTDTGCIWTNLLFSLFSHFEIWKKITKH